MSDKKFARFVALSEEVERCHAAYIEANERFEAFRLELEFEEIDEYEAARSASLSENAE